MFRKEANLKAQKPATQNPNVENLSFSKKHQMILLWQVKTWQLLSISCVSPRKSNSL